MNKTPRASVEDITPTSASADAQFSISDPISTLYNVCDRLLLPPHTTTTTAVTFFHQFDAYFTHNQLPILPSLLILASIQLACKSTENHRKLRDIVNCLYTTTSAGGGFMRINEEYWKIRDSVGRLEFMCLRILRFELIVPLCYPWIVRISRAMMEESASGRAVCQVAFGLANDAYELGLEVEYSPRVLAVGCVYVGVRCLGMNLPVEFGKWAPFWAHAESEVVRGMVEKLIKYYV